MAGEITIIGLGPGPPAMLTKQAWDRLERSNRVWARTAQHPALAYIGDEIGLEIHAFDDLYETAESFTSVYEKIVDKILELAEEPDGVVYAVPGDPLVGETTVSVLMNEAESRGISVTIIHGLSFIEPSLRLVDIDALDGIYICDALDLADSHHPPFPPDSPALIGQVYSRLTASDIKLSLMNQYPADHAVCLIHRAGSNLEVVDTIPLAKLDRREDFSTMTSLLIPALEQPSAFERFQATVAHLRAPEGCPWDREQTHQSLRNHIMEEAYETLQAIDDDNMEALQEELGDLLLQIVLQAQIATEEGDFTMAEVISGIHAKLVRRHPHVFGDLDVEDVDQVLHNWESLKELERSEGGSALGLLDGVPINLPALAQAEEIQDRVVRVGFDWPAIEGVLDKVNEELEEVAHANDEHEIASEMGDLLFAVVNYARWLGVDAEAALRSANRRFRRRFHTVEQAARTQGTKLADMSLNEMEELWQAAKEIQE